jgi:hypothetical protein
MEAIITLAAIPIMCLPSRNILTVTVVTDTRILSITLSVLTSQVCNNPLYYCFLFLREIKNTIHNRHGIVPKFVSTTIIRVDYPFHIIGACVIQHVANSQKPIIKW